MVTKYKMHEGVKYCSEDLAEIYLNQTWRPNMSITGAGGLPEYTSAGNVVRPSTSVRVSVRLPPTKDAAAANEIIKQKLMADVPYNCKVTVKSGNSGNGWCMKEMDESITTIMSQVGKNCFDGNDWGSQGLGGSIPFLSQLGKMYPKCNILPMGVIGPNSNAHGPDEAIHLPFAKKLTMALSHIFIELGCLE